MADQIVRRSWYAVPREIVGAAADQEPDRAETPHDQIGIRYRQGGDRQIDPVFDEVDHAVAHHHAQLDVWIKRSELGNDRRQQDRHRERHVEVQRAARLRLHGLNRAVRLVHVGKNLHAALVVGSADFGQADLARAAIEKTHAEPVFKILYLRRHRTGRNAELARRRRETARLRDLYKGGYAGHAIHGSLLHFPSPPIARVIASTAAARFAAARFGNESPRHRGCRSMKLSDRPSALWY